MIRDITNKTTTLRTAKAQAIIFCKEETLELVKTKKIPKGDVLEFARAAGYFGAKNTAHLIPHCHPISFDSLKFDFEFLTEENYRSTSRVFDQFTSQPSYRAGIVVICEAKCIGRTGIEIEALTGATVAALTIYDILKPVDDNLELSHIKVLEKTGGKSDRKYFQTSPTCAVLVCSDSAFEKKREDTSGAVVRQLLQEHNADVVAYVILPDEKNAIQRQIQAWVENDIHFIFTTGGTGVGPKDITIEAVKEILEKEADGIVEAMRVHGQLRTPLAMMSRSVAGSIRQTTIVTLPGSSNGAKESLEAILPAVFHARSMLQGGGH